MIHRTLTAALAGLLLTTGAAKAESVEVYLVDMLDNIQNGYCLDIAGGREADADPADGLQAHTCYSPGGAIGVDQTFDTDRFAEGLFDMTEFDVCAEITWIDAGSALELAECDGREAQGFTVSGEGMIVPASAPDMCVTVGDDTRTGRSDTNQTKDLTLEACDDDKAAFQTWSVRTVK